MPRVTRGPTSLPARSATRRIEELDKVIGRVADGDRFLLCSDGLSKVLDDNTILGLLAATPVGETAAKLVDATLDRNATDNVTAVVMEVVADERD